MQSNISKDLYNYGAVAGVLAIILQLGYYLSIDQFSLLGKVSEGFLIVVNFLVCFWSVVELKKRKGGFATFKEVFSVFMINRIINITLSVGFVVLLYFVIDTDFRDLIVEKQYEMQYERLLNLNISEERIENQLAIMSNWNAKNIKVYLATWSGYIVVNAIISLIVAAAMKKNNPEF
ncbi:MAG: DUF4199 domain-containing protein [Bacteroidota bacterium]|nr:DUF4199 domain-containing protein [Bacteroidota bacterium]